MNNKEKKNITLKDVSQLARVSTAVVSHVINGTKPVSDELRSRVVSAINELGYVPDLRARSLKSARIKSIYIIFTYSNEVTTKSRYFTETIASISASAGEDNYLAIVSSIPRNRPIEKYIEGCYRSGMAGGIIMIGLTPSEVEQTVKVLGPFPTMLIGSTPNNEDVSYVDADNEGGVQQIFDYLRGLGHQRIAYINPTQVSSQSDKRLSTYRELMMKHDLENFLQIYNLSFIEGDYGSLESLYQNQPTAIISFDDILALKTQNYLLKKGMRVPEDVSLVGFDDEYFTQFMSPRLTTVKQAFSEMGALGAKKLIEIIENQVSTPFQYIFPTEMIIRESCLPVSQNNGRHSEL